MHFTEAFVLGHHILCEGIWVDPTKIEVIIKLSSPTNKKDIHILLGYVGYYRIFIKNFTKVASPLFRLLTKIVEFQWND